MSAIKLHGEKHHIRNLFRKETSPEKENKEPHGLSRLFHHERSSSQSSAPSPIISRTPSLLSMRRNNSVKDKKDKDKPNTSKDKPKKAPKDKKMQKQASFHISSPSGSSPRLGAHDSHSGSETALANRAPGIVYNPYGINKTPSQQLPKNASFYLSGNGDGERVLANPVADPNDYLPEELKQDHVNLLQDFEIDVSTRKLGDGGSSDVRIINAINHKKEYYALKKFTLLSKETDEEFYRRVIKEFIISKRIATQRHVINTLALVRIQSQNNMTRGWGMVLEFCSGGDLFSAIVKPGWKRASLAEKYCIFKQVAYGLRSLHELDIVHRDLKPENVLIDANGVAKLCDFGVSDYGHEEPGNFDSPVKLSHTYVGSPPYVSPEVMLLKEKSTNDCKNFPYDPFKMDHWALGMLLFCIAYCGVPFMSATLNDHGYRDYKFNHDRFSSDHPHFKHKHDQIKGPGSEFKWAAQFHSNGAARVAWKLCDPSVNCRYNLDDLFADPWFTSLEMCLYEHPDPDVNPFVLPGTGQNLNNVIASASNTPQTGSASTSRRATHIKSSSSQSIDRQFEPQTPVRSMLDLAEDFDKKVLEKKESDDEQDQSSVHSASSLTYDVPKVNEKEKERKVDELPKVEELPKEEHDDPKDLPKVEEKEEHNESPKEELSKVDELPEEHHSPTVFELNRQVLKSLSDLHLDDTGSCDLGYKIKRHHHTEITSYAVSGNGQRKR